MNLCKCGEPSVMQPGNYPRCAKHYRFLQMRASAKRRGKQVPTVPALESMLPSDMKCPDCGVVMNWLARDDRKRVATLQHYRNGTMGVVCMVCNAAHSFMPGDSYRTRPTGHKWCSACLRMLAYALFGMDRRKNSGLSSLCRPCKSTRERARRRNDHHMGAQQ